jgi:hypothetical protein
MFRMLNFTHPLNPIHPQYPGSDKRALPEESARAHRTIPIKYQDRFLKSGPRFIGLERFLNI